MRPRRASRRPFAAAGTRRSRPRARRAASTRGLAPGSYAPTSRGPARSRRAARRRAARRAARCSGVVTRDATREIDAEHVDRREVAGGRELAVEHDVAVEDRARGVRDRLVVVVAVDEHRVDAGDRADRAGAGALEQPGEQRRRRSAGSRGSRAARRRTGRSRAAPWRRGSASPSSAARAAPSSRNDSAMRVAVKAARARMRAGWSAVETTTTERARPSGPRSSSRNSRTSRPRSPIRAMTVTCGVGAAGDHRQQRRLADAGAGEEADALPAADGGEGVERAHAEVQRARRCGRGRARTAARRRPARAASKRERARGRRWGGRVASSTRPSRPAPVGTVSRRPVARTGAPTRMPSIRSIGMSVSPCRVDGHHLGPGDGRRRRAAARPWPPRCHARVMPRPTTAATAPIALGARGGRAARRVRAAGRARCRRSCALPARARPARGRAPRRCARRRRRRAGPPRRRRGRARGRRRAAGPGARRPARLPRARPRGAGAR